MSVNREYGKSSFLSFDEWWIAGGTASNSLDTSELLQSGNSNTIPYVDLPEACYDHVMVRVNDTAVIFVACPDHSGRVYLYDKDRQLFSQLETLTSGRYAPFAGTIKLLFYHTLNTEFYRIG